MSEIKDDRQYTENHEWVSANADGTHTLGITDHAQAQLGDMVFVELPAVGDTVAFEEEFCVVESVKAASGVGAPAELEVVEINAALDDAPELVNSDCYAEGWLVRVKFSAEIAGLLDASAYQKLLDSE